MFEQLPQRTWFPSPMAGFIGAVIGAFALGVGVGKLITGLKPWDWTLTVLDLSILASYTCWFAVAVFRTLSNHKAE